MPQAVNAIVIEEEILPAVDIDIPTPGASRGTNRTSAPHRMPSEPVRRGPSTVTVAGSPLELLLHAFGRRSAADVQVDGPSDGMSSFTRWATRA